MNFDSMDFMKNRIPDNMSPEIKRELISYSESFVEFSDFERERLQSLINEYPETARRVERILNLDKLQKDNPDVKELVHLLHEDIKTLIE